MGNKRLVKLKYWIKIFTVIILVSISMSYILLSLWQIGGDFIIGNFGRGFIGSFLFGLWMIVCLIITLGLSFYICFNERVIGR